MGVYFSLFNIKKMRGVFMSSKERKCNFCGKSEDDVKKLIQGKNDVYICEECVELCGEILEELFEEEKSNSGKKLTLENLPKPKEIKEYLDE